MPPLSGSNPSGGRTSLRSTGVESTGSRSTGSSSSSSSASTSTDDLPTVKCVLVGDGAVGKTSLVVGYSKSEQPSPDYVPTAFDNYSVIVNIDGRPIKLNMCDTAGQDELDSLRSLCYSDADVFLVCFSVVCQSSYENVTAKWLPEIRNHCSSNRKEAAAPILLVGTQSDLRLDPATLDHLGRYGERPVPPADGVALAAGLGGSPSSSAYLECSAATNAGVKDVFDAAIFAALDRRGLVRRCRRGLVGSIRGRKNGERRYRCASKLWEREGDEAAATPAPANDKRRTRWKLFSCFSK